MLLHRLLLQSSEASAHATPYSRPCVLEHQTSYKGRFSSGLYPLYLSGLRLTWGLKQSVDFLSQKKNATTLESPARACCSPGADRDGAAQQRTHGGKSPVNVLTAPRFRRRLHLVSAEAGVVNKIRIPAVFSHCFLLFLSSLWQGRRKPASALQAPLPRGGVRVSRRREAAPVICRYPGFRPANAKYF